jgi:hypothetical protein
MKPYELFGVLMKALGVCLVIIGASQLPRATAVADAFSDEFGFVKMFMTNYAANFIEVAVGFALVFKTGWITNLAFSDEFPGEITKQGDASEN